MSQQKADFSEFNSGWRILVIAMLDVAENVNASLLYAFGTLVLSCWAMLINPAW